MRSPLRARYWKVDSLVESLLANTMIVGPHVNLTDIVGNYPVRISMGDLGEVSGLLVRGEHETIIGVNSTQHKTRQRFTIAHELGHFFLHEGIQSHFDENFRINYRDSESSQATNVEEIEANYFAASLLMPKRFLDADGARDLLDSDAGVRNIAKRYFVSQHAMSLRLANLYGDTRPF